MATSLIIEDSTVAAPSRQGCDLHLRFAWYVNGADDDCSTLSFNPTFDGPAGIIDAFDLGSGPEPHRSE